MSRAHLEDIVRRFHTALRSADPALLADVYADYVTVWHSFDRVDQTREQNLRTLAWMAEHVEGLSYDDVRVAYTDDGFVQQHLFRSTRPPLEVPCMLRAWCRGDKIVRIEEYLDSADTVALREYVAGLRANRSGD
jgi:ketosteroid isomerase-like protein